MQGGSLVLLLLLLWTLVTTTHGAIKQQKPSIDFGLLENGIYRLKSCGIWPRCFDFAEHMGFTNKSCSGTREPPVVLRDFSKSRRWKSWNVTFSNLEKSSVDATFQAFWPKDSKTRPKCDGGFVRDDTPSSSCKGEKESPLFLSQKEPERMFRIRAADDESGCVHVYDPKRENAGCPSLFAAAKDCNGDLNVVLESKDDGSFRHRWQLVPETGT